MYNDVRIQPVLVKILVDGATRDALRGTDTFGVLHERRAQKLKGKSLLFGLDARKLLKIILEVDNVILICFLTFARVE